MLQQLNNLYICLQIINTRKTQKSMKKIWLVTLALSVCSMFAFAQIDKMKDILDDEMDTGNFRLYFLNALDGEPVIGAVVELDGIGLYETDPEGKIIFPRTEEDGDIGVHFKAKGFIDTDINVEVVAGTIFNNRVSVSPEMAIEYMRIILDWGRSPKDLDAHLTKDKKYHISYRDKKVSDDGIATLDRDDTDSFGPETITVKEIDGDSHYIFWVQDFSNRNDNNSKSLSKSGATIKVYGNGELMESVSVPSGERGNKWNVFEIVNGKINLLNYVSSDGE
jgi:hypothetical protein